ncbi:MAG: hypothetical protein HYY04_05995 [Chloroflexi bacterium]|nr:hypothetical protein [Chloroflexota bacterium]
MEWSLTRRLSLGYAVLIVGLAVVAAAAWYGLAALGTQATRGWQQTQSLSAASDVRRQVAGAVQAELLYLANPGTTALAEVAARRRAFDRALRNLESSGPAGAAAAGAIETQGQHLLETVDEAVRLARDGRSAEAITVHRNTIDPLLRDLDRLVAAVETEALGQSEQARSGAEASAARLAVAAFGIALVALIVGLALAVTTIRSTASRLRDAITAISGASAEFTATANEQASGSSQQAAAVGEITATMEELARTAEQIAHSSEQTLQTAEGGRIAVGDALDGMARIKTKVETVAGRVLALGEKSQQIGEITDIISDIANKTHLLALNAAIESAAAGEYGRRFAVVASQVKELADETKSATNQVKAIIAEIRGATNASVLATEDATREADTGSALAQRAGQAIDDIVQMVHTISLATQQQRTASEQVVRTMHDIAEVARDSAHGSQQAAEGAARLNATAGRLRAVVEGRASAPARADRAPA